MIVFGLVSTVFDLVTFFVLQRLFRASEQEFQTTWFVVSVLTELVVVLILRTHLPAWKSRPSRTLVTITAVVAMLVLSIPYLDGIASAFGFIPLPATLLFSVLAIVASYAAATEAMKLTIARRAMA
jgi:Mg2+-importing ATPase